MKLILSFLISVSFVIIIGSVSYNKASKAIIENYDASCQQAIDMTGEYISFGLESAESTAMQYSIDTKIQNYLYGIYNEDPVELYNINKDITSSLLARQASDQFIENIHMMSSSIERNMSTSGIFISGLFKEFSESAAASGLKDGTNASYWIGKDEALDQRLSLDTDAYAMRHIKSFNNGEAIIIIDISTSSLQAILERLDFGKGSIVGMVTSDGREFINSSEVNTAEGNSSEVILGQEEFYKSSVQSEDISGSENVTYQGDNYLYLYSKVGDTGVTICALVPEETLLQKINSIKNLTILLVFIASILAIIIGVLMATGIQHIIQHIIGELKKISQGNLTVKLKVKRKDEFLVLAEGVNDTIDNMRGLIERVFKESASVTKSSLQVRKSSEVFSRATEGITEAINEIQTGINQQAQDSENCLVQMDGLSNKITLVMGKTNEISLIAKDTKYSIKQGVDTMQTLNSKANSTTEITQQIIHNIETLEEKSKSISKIVGTINSIAAETNLLSLNASIEAARAGAAGSGFKVVATEIRKLADQSVQAVHEIETLIKDIQKETKAVVITANQAETIVMEQGVAVGDTEKSFSDMNDHVERLIENVAMILDSIHTMEESRANTLAAIENISAVSQQTAAATLSVGEATNSQMEAVISLDSLSKELSENALALEEAIDRFKVE
jgi:methyl-accepting chemotaxis protein